MPVRHPAIPPRLACAGVAMLGLAAVAGASPALARSPSPAGTSVAAPAGGGRFVVTAQRTIELPDSRIISMSPDGAWLAIARPALGYQRGQLCVVAVATLADRACADLSGLGAGIRLEDVTWSPDGSHLAFGENALVTLKDGDLWLMDAATGGLTNLDDDGFDGSIPLTGVPAGTTITVPTSPAFSPDGATIAFSRTTFGADGISNTIASVPAAGGPVTDLRTVADQPGIAYFGIGWAPDGKQLYYSIQHQEKRDLGNGVWVMDADGSDARLLVGRYQDSYGPTVLQVSPDGSALLLQDPDAMGRFDGQLPVYAVADAASGRPVPLLPPGEHDLPVPLVGWAGFSPDGSALMLLLRGSDPDLQAWIREDPLGASPVDEPLLPDGLAAAGPIDRGIAPTWATNGTLLLTGAGAFETATLLTIEDRGAAAP